MQPLAAKSASSALLSQGDLIRTGRQPAAAFRGSKVLLRDCGEKIWNILIDFWANAPFC